MAKPKRCRFCGGVIVMAAVKWAHRYDKDRKNCGRIPEPAE